MQSGVKGLSDEMSDVDGMDAEVFVQAYVNIVAGACISLGKWPLLCIREIICKHILRLSFHMNSHFNGLFVRIKVYVVCRYMRMIKLNNFSNRRENFDHSIELCSTMMIWDFKLKSSI